MEQVKEVITSKRQIDFYKQCYGLFGYELIAADKSGHNTILTFRHNPGTKANLAPVYLPRAEAKLRVVELISRKKHGFRSLFVNLFAQILCFCVQGVIFLNLRLDTANPRIMLQIGTICLGSALFFGLFIKCMEWFRWNQTQKRLQKEILALKDLPSQSAEDGRTKIISVLFTRGHGSMGTFLYWVTGREYTHSAIGLGAGHETFYSFDYRGFRTEHPAHRKIPHGRRDSLCYQFKVTPEEYARVEAAINACLAEKQAYHYNLAGAIFSVLHIYMPFKGRQRYFCSEFVSEQLLALDSFHLKRVSAMYLPTNLAKALAQQDNIEQVLVNVI